MIRVLVVGALVVGSCGTAQAATVSNRCGYIDVKPVSPTRVTYCPYTLTGTAIWPDQPCTPLIAPTSPVLATLVEVCPPALPQV